MDEIDNIAYIPKCVCSTVACTCNYNAKLQNYEQINKLSQFVMGLSDQYITIRGQLLMMIPLPSLSQAYSLLLQEESQRDCTIRSVISENTTMNVHFAGAQIRNFSAKKKNSSKNTSVVTGLVCEFCRMAGHSKDKYFCIYVYSKWHKLYEKSKPKPQNANIHEVVSNVHNVADNSTVSSYNGDDNVANKDTFIAAQCEQIAKTIKSSHKFVQNVTATNSFPIHMQQVHLQPCLLHRLLIKLSVLLLCIHHL